MRLLLLVSCLLVVHHQAAASTMQLESGSIRGVLIESNGHRMAVYGWKPNDLEGIEQVLLTHGRRDVAWKARPLADAGVHLVAPERERYALEKPADFWKAFHKLRYHDYAQQTTKILAEPLPIERWVKDGDTIEWQGLTIKVLATPGFTRGSVSFLTEIDDARVAFTGDLIYGDGQILDLYSFQDAIPDAQIRGYHGYGSRLAELIASLRKVAMAQPDVIVPARGPIIRDPQAAIQRLIDRVQRLYSNYLSTNALHWYFKEDRMRACAARVLGDQAEVKLMPYSHHEQTPPWVFEQGTSRLLISDTGSAFLLDCGSQRVLDRIDELLAKKVIRNVEGIFVTHYHDDHTDFVQHAAERYECPVYATREYADVLKHPEAYHLPAMTANAINNIRVVGDGHMMQWHEFKFTLFFFPGQTYFHGALFAQKPEETPVFFIGDAFAPSGFDDYCVRNRNLLGENKGYLYCLKKLRAIDTPFWLVNEHIPYVFSFSDEELAYLETTYRERIALQRELYPWDNPNFGVDDRWAVFYPHGLDVQATRPFEISLQITNHSPRDRMFRCTLHLPHGWQTTSNMQDASIVAGTTQSLRFNITPRGPQGNFLITADIESTGISLRRWSEAIITVK